MYAFLRAPQSPADFSGMVPVWRKIDACVQEMWRSKNKKSGENIILCCFSLTRDTKTQPEGSWGPFGVLWPPSPALGCSHCPLRVTIEDTWLWGCWGPCRALRGYGVVNGRGTWHRSWLCLTAQQDCSWSWVMECFRLLYHNSWGVRWASAHTSCLPPEARTELPAKSVFLRNVENVTILQSGGSHHIIILMLNSMKAETYRALLNLYKGNEGQNAAAGSKRNCQNHHKYLRCFRKCHGCTGNDRSHQGSPGLALLEGAVVKWTSMPTGGRAQNGALKVWCGSVVAGITILALGLVCGLEMI